MFTWYPEKCFLFTIADSLESDHGESFGLSVDAILVEFDLEQIADLQTLDGVLKVLIRRPPRQIT